MALRPTLFLVALSLAATAVSSAAASSTAAASSAAHACTAGVTTSKGVTSRTFCGRATATFTAGGKTFHLSQGACQRMPKYLTVSIGVWTDQTSGSRPDYFGLNVGRTAGSSYPAAGKDGTYTQGVVAAVDVGGKAYALDTRSVAVVLAGNRTRGTLSGSTFDGQKVSATFHCS